MLSGDGVSPFKRSSYSMWPLALACANLPGHLRMTLPATWIFCIVPAKGKDKGEPKDFQPFLEIVVDELNAYYQCGLKDVQDSSHRYKPPALQASQPERFDCKVKLLMGVMDYPGWGHLTRLSWMGSSDAAQERACNCRRLLQVSCQGAKAWEEECLSRGIRSSPCKYGARETGGCSSQP